MSDTYELLTPATVPAYVAADPDLAPHAGTDPQVRELSDGNLNLVFHVRGTGGDGLVIKQALPFVRTDPSWPMTPERAWHETDALRAHGLASPEHTPTLLGSDRGRYVLAMEDLTDHVVWRTALDAGLRHEHAAGDLGRYVARVAFHTSVLGMSPLEQKAALARSVNPQLCQITEDLVFTEPFVTHAHNVVLPANGEDVAALASDQGFMRAIGAAKLAFMTHAEALVHGDLHTGSVMVRDADGDVPASTKAIDSEFAFYGPVGFDLGILWANHVLAAAASIALGRDDHATWCLTLPGVTFAAFEDELRALWPDRVDPRVWGDDTLEDLLDHYRADATVFAGAECARRVVGFAKVSGIESLPEALREGAVRGALRCARVLALASGHHPDPDALSASLRAVLDDAATTGEQAA